MKSLGKYTVFYIGYCADEFNRFNKRANMKEIYPLAENGINESKILEWAKTVDLFNNYYKTNKRCGCMYCPLASKMQVAYLYKYYPENYKYMIDRMKETEKIRESELGKDFSVYSSNPKYNAEYLDYIIKNKYISLLDELESQNIK